MPPSQLKRLKASLREQGITGPQKSKKQKKAASKDKTPSDRVNRNAALQQIRDSFNPFEFRQPSRPEKFTSVSQKSVNNAGKKYKEVLHRPGVTKSAGEELRRRELLPEMQRRNKVGGLVDRRIGEGDPGMTPAERAAQRFAMERRTKDSLFDLEGSDDGEPMGKSLEELEKDDFDAGSLTGSDDDGAGLLRRKRPRDEDLQDMAVPGPEDEPDRKKTKKEVMDEVIAKSKYHKYERQKAKEDDDDIRAELDQGMGEMLALLRGHPPPPRPKPEEPAGVSAGKEPVVNPDRQKLLDGMDRAKADKEYEVRLRQLAQDTRAKPTDRTRTAEEKAADDAARLNDLEEKRQKRMRGEPVSEDEDQDQHESDDEAQFSVDQLGNDVIADEAVEFGFAGSSAKPTSTDAPFVHDDEDEFNFDEDLIASGSDIDVSDESHSIEESDSDVQDTDDIEKEEEEDEFVRGILGDTKDSAEEKGKASIEQGIAFMYPCPRTHGELLNVLKDVSVERWPTVVQRIRALHHPSLSASNKEAMADFATALVDHVSFMGMQKQSLVVAEQLIRHLHSLSRSYPERIADTFRAHLKTFHERGQPSAGDLVLLTAIGSIYPTSDHFHQVVTPAITLMARWLGLHAPTNPVSMDIGAFLVALCVSFQRLSRRFVPEAVRFTIKALVSSTDANALRPHLNNLVAMADLWKDKSALNEIFRPALPILQKLGAKQKLQNLKILMGQSRQRTRPLELHHHRPQPIRTSIPKFEEGFNPDKHYDPDKERSDTKKLQKEYKRERKGALRELRKDANFIAREQLREKKLRDEEYEKKQRRLIAEIQGEEGHEAKEYEREKRKRKAQR